MMKAHSRSLLPATLLPLVYRLLLLPDAGVRLAKANTSSQFLGTAEECCCGDEPARGTCCELKKHGPDACELVTDVDCGFGELYSAGGTCPETAYRCHEEEIVCPSPVGNGTTTTTATAAPTATPPELAPLDFGCGYMYEGINGPVNSKESCQAACEAYGMFCHPYNNISICGSSFRTGRDCRGNEYTECTCGSNNAGPSAVRTLCETRTPLPETCLELVGGLAGVGPITNMESCTDACQYFDLYCMGPTEQECGSDYRDVEEFGFVYPTCYCGPEGSGTRHEVCGSPCGSGGASLRIRRFLLSVPVVVALFLFSS